MSYKIRRINQEITDKKEIKSIIENSKICRLALCDGIIPYIVPLNFGFKDNSIYFHCAKEGRKIDILSKNRNVCVEFEEEYEIVEKEVACDWTCYYRSVIAFGTAEILTDYDEKLKALKILMSQYSSKDYSFTDNQISKVAIIRVKIEAMTGKKLEG